MLEWGFCIDYTDVFKYPHNGGNVHSCSQPIHLVVVHWDVFIQEHGGLLSKQMAKSYCKVV